LDNIIYRDAVQSDIPEITKICFEYFPNLDVGIPMGSLNSETITTHLCLSIGPGKPPTILAVDSGEIVGVYGLDVERYWWMETFYVSDYMWYVKEGHRNKNLGRNLRKKAVEWASKKGLPFRPTDVNLDRLPAKDRQLRMDGFTRVGSIYMKL
jgi:GNAT superfamily N-acetyltransferase